MKQLNVPQSGSQANTTASHNRAGQYLRSRRSPVQPIGTGRRSFIRAAFGAAASGFAALTTVQQDAWSSFASSHPITDALGQSITLTGQQMFVSCGTQLINCGQALPADPPVSATVDNLSPVTATFSLATGLEVDWNAGDAANFVTVAIMGPFSSAVRFNKTFWQPPGALGVSAANIPTLTIATAVAAGQFGTVALNQWWFVKVTPVNAGGMTGAPTIIRTTVVA
jgi:hypothetical protein